MSKKREHYVGVRLTRNERDILNRFVSKRNITLTDFFRDAIFSHLKYIQEEDRSLNLHEITSSINEVKSALKRISQHIKKIDEEIHVYSLKSVK